MSLATLFPFLLVLHIGLALALLLPSLLLPFALRARPATQPPTGPISRALLWLQSTGSAVIGLGLALTGVGMLIVLGPQVLAQPWLLLALVIYGANLAVALFVQRPGLRRLVGKSVPVDEAAREVWRARARRQRYVSYAMAGAVGVIAFLMSTKPDF